VCSRRQHHPCGPPESVNGLGPPPTR
jgi:hypothetical protein